MDQRVDNEARPDSAPNRAAELAGGATTKTKSWLDTLRKRRALATAIAIGTAVAAARDPAVVAACQKLRIDRRRLYRYPHGADQRPGRRGHRRRAGDRQSAGRSRRRIGPLGRSRLHRRARSGASQRRQSQGSNRRAKGQDRPSRQAGRAGASRADFRATGKRPLSAARQAGRRHRRTGAAIRFEPAAEPGHVRRRAGQRRRHRETGSRARGAAEDVRSAAGAGRGQSVAHHHHRAGRRRAWRISPPPRAATPPSARR